MPVVGCRDQNNVKILFFQHSAVVAVDVRFLLRRLPFSNHFTRGGQHLFIHITQRHNLDRRYLDQSEQIALAVPPASDQTYPRLAISKLLGISTSQRKSHDGARLQKFSTFHDKVSLWLRFS